MYTNGFKKGWSNNLERPSINANLPIYGAIIPCVTIVIIF